MPYPQDYKCTCKKGRLCRFCDRQEKAFYDDQEVLEPVPETYFGIDYFVVSEDYDWNKE